MGPRLGQNWHEHAAARIVGDTNESVVHRQGHLVARYGKAVYRRVYTVGLCLERHP